MYDALLVSVLQGVADRENDTHGTIRREDSVRVATAFKGIALDILHGDIAIVPMNPGIIYRHNVGVIQAP